MEVIFEGKAYTLTNVYNPPTKDLTLDVDPGVISRMIIGGDFNAHSPAWGYSAHNRAGLTLESTFVLLEDTDTPPTLLHSRSGDETRPDLTFVSADLVGSLSMQVCKS